MSEIIVLYYTYIKALHIIAVVSWMAGLLYLPRLFVYHTGVENGSSTDALFQKMEYRLLKYIMTPAMIMSWILGLSLVFIPGVIGSESIWFIVKFVSVILMTVFHFWLSSKRKHFVLGINKTSDKTFRFSNEIPTVLMIIIVFMVIVKPF